MLIVGPLLEALLPLSRVPVQLLRDAAHPVLAPFSLRHDICEGISGSRDRDIVAGVELDPAFHQCRW